MKYYVPADFPLSDAGMHMISHGLKCLFEELPLNKQTCTLANIVSYQGSRMAESGVRKERIPSKFLSNSSKTNP